MSMDFELASTASMVSVDWGTTSFRAYLVEAGRIVADVSEESGILAVNPGEHGAVLRGLIERLPAAARDLPIMMSGMIGSRQGWVEAPYVLVPATLDDLAAKVIRIKEPGLGPISLIPGVMKDPLGGVPDVMRGEETQLFGAMALTGMSGGLFIMPGTHSKKVVVEGGALRDFSTFMTGEVFAALKGHTILGRLMAEGERSGEGFKAGLDAASRLESAGDLLHALFATRTQGLFSRLPAVELGDYLSGLLIGAELCAALPEGGTAMVIGSQALTGRYVEAALHLGRHLVPAPDRCVVAGQLAVLARMGA
jgi:2-dehydro-3-deoxygalactonokinase